MPVYYVDDNWCCYRCLIKSIRSVLFFKQAEEVSTLLGELVETVGLEMKGLEELINTSKRITTLQVNQTLEEYNIHLTNITLYLLSY